MVLHLGSLSLGKFCQLWRFPSTFWNHKRQDLARRLHDTWRHWVVCPTHQKFGESCQPNPNYLASLPQTRPYLWSKRRDHGTVSKSREQRSRLALFSPGLVWSGEVLNRIRLWPWRKASLAPLAARLGPPLILPWFAFLSWSQIFSWI
jgi:hypothetical protein